MVKAGTNELYGLGFQRRRHLVPHLAGLTVSVILLLAPFASRAYLSNLGFSSGHHQAFGIATRPRARLSATPTVQAAHINPEISLQNGYDLLTTYTGPAELTKALEQNLAQPLSLASADFDEDGVPDLISGYSYGGRGIVTLLRGNIDSIYPNAPEAKQRKANGEFTDAPFLSPA